MSKRVTHTYTVNGRTVTLTDSQDRAVIEAGAFGTTWPHPRTRDALRQAGILTPARGGSMTLTEHGKRVAGQSMEAGASPMYVTALNERGRVTDPAEAWIYAHAEHTRRELPPPEPSLRPAVSSDTVDPAGSTTDQGEIMNERTFPVPNGEVTVRVDGRNENGVEVTINGRVKIRGIDYLIKDVDYTFMPVPHPIYRDGKPSGEHSRWSANPINEWSLRGFFRADTGGRVRYRTPTREALAALVREALERFAVDHPGFEREAEIKSLVAKVRDARRVVIDAGLAYEDAKRAYAEALRACNVPIMGDSAEACESRRAAVTPQSCESCRAPGATLAVLIAGGPADGSEDVQAMLCDSCNTMVRCNPAAGLVLAPILGVEERYIAQTLASQ